MNTQSCKYSCKNSYLQILIHRGSTSACGEKFTVMTACNMFGKRHYIWGAQKPCAIRADTSIDFPSLTRVCSACSKRLLFEHPHYRQFTDTCGCNPKNVGTVTGNSINWIGMASRRTWWPRLASAPRSRGERLRGKSSRAPVTPPQRSPDTAAKRAAPRVTARPLPAQQLCLLALKLLACQIALFQEPG